MNAQQIIKTLAANNIASATVAPKTVGITVGDWVAVIVQPTAAGIEVSLVAQKTLTPVQTEYGNKYNFVRLVTELLEQVQ